MKTLLIFLLILPVISFADGKLAFSCNLDGSNCAVNFINPSGKATKLADSFTRFQTENKMRLKYYPNHLGAFTLSCGSPCNTSVFVNLQTGEMSPVGYFLPMAVDPDHWLVVYPGDDADSVNVSNIFAPDHHTMVIKRDFSTYIFNSGSAKFLPDAKLWLNYTKGSHFVDTTEIIPLDYKMLGVESNS